MRCLSIWCWSHACTSNADGSEQQIGYPSQTLTNAERKYSNWKGGLGLCIGVRRFHSYLFGHPFKLWTDHQPLLALLTENRSTTPQASGIGHWAFLLSAYEYILQFRNTPTHGNADALSRLPLPTVPEKTTISLELVLAIEHLADSLVTAGQIRVWTQIGNLPYQQSFSLSGKGGQTSATQSWHRIRLERQNCQYMKAVL